MEYPCYQCKTPVEEGVAFCPQCNAPLIRVSMPETAPSPDPATLTVQELPRPQVPPPGKIQWSRAFTPAALAGLVAFCLAPFFFGVMGLGMILAGILSVVFYRWRTQDANLTPGMGLRLGALTGFFGFLPLLVLVISGLVLSDGSKLREAVQQAVERSARASDPQSQQLLEFVHTQQGLAVFMTASMIFVFLVMVVLTSLGGALGAVLLRHKPHE